MAESLSDPAHNSTVMMTKPIETSYDTICAAERNAARNGYFEFDAQPAMMMPYTLSDEIAKTYRMPTLISAITQPELTGITAQAASASVQVTSGARRNTPLFAPAGMVGSLNTNLSRSANDCSRPHGPTTLGPRRICTAAQIFRSAKST